MAGADKAGDATLTGPGGIGGASVDRVVGFAGTYPDNNIPLGPIVQVRRDDAYRRLQASLNGPTKLVWHCAYYITKDTPNQPTTIPGGPSRAGLVPEEGNPDEPAAGGEAPATDQPAATDQPGAPDQSAATDQPAPEGDSEGNLTYDQILDQNVSDDVAVVEGAEPWGGMIFGFTLDDTVEDSKPDDDSALQPYDDSALDELKE